MPEGIAKRTPLREIELLKDQAAFVPTNPRSLLDFDRDVHEFQDELKATVESKEFKKHLGSKVDRRYGSKIHEEKVNMELLPFLKVKGLVKDPNPSESHWFRFENKTAKLYMSLLAEISR